MKTHDEYIQEITSKIDKQLESVDVLFRIKYHIESLGFNYNTTIDSDYKKLWFDLNVDSFYEVLPILEALDSIGEHFLLSYDDDEATYRAYSYSNVIVFAYPKNTASCEVIEVPSTIKKFKCA